MILMPLTGMEILIQTSNKKAGNYPALYWM